MKNRGDRHAGLSPLFVFLLCSSILFSLKTIALPKVEISRLRARPKGFPIALWKPSGLSPCCYVFIAKQYKAIPHNS